MRALKETLDSVNPYSNPGKNIRNVAGASDDVYQTVCVSVNVWLR
jgi:hypothetical protein